MPTKQVYGKRSRVHGRNAAFEVPEISTRKDVVDTLAERVSGLAVTSCKDAGPERKPLAIRSPNAHLDNFDTDRDTAWLKKKSAEDHKQPRRSRDNEAGLQDTKEGSAHIASPQGSLGPRQPQGSPADFRSKAIADLERDDHASLTPQPALKADLTTLHLTPLLPLASSPVTTFAAFDAALSQHLSVTKIAEASYSQVFSLTPLHQPKKRLIPSVLKLIPLTPPASLYPKRPTKSFVSLLSLSSKPANVASEVKLLQHLTRVPGHTTYRGLHLLCGPPPPSFSAAHKAFNASQRAAGKDESYFPDPNRRGAYAATQLWAAVEMADAGPDLERWMDSDEWRELGIWAVWDSFWQVALAYAKAEVEGRWEGRDGHCGNICLRRIEGVSEWEEVRKRGRTVGCAGLEVTVIDYTLSRAEVPTLDGEGIEVVCNDLDEDPELFEGDGEVEYQYDMYRYMRNAAFLGNPLADWEASDRSLDKDSSWNDYHPETNLVWLHFVLRTLWLKYKGQRKYSTVGTATEPSARETEMETILSIVNDKLQLKYWADSGLRSASDLVTMALKESWLQINDVIGLIGEEKPKKRRAKVAHRTREAQVGGS